MKHCLSVETCSSNWTVVVQGIEVKKKNQTGRSNTNSKNTGISEWHYLKRALRGCGHEQSQICNLIITYLIIVQLSVFMAITAAEFVWWILLNLFLKKKKNLSENEKWYWKKILFSTLLGHIIR